MKQCLELVGMVMNLGLMQGSIHYKDHKEAGN